MGTFRASDKLALVDGNIGETSVPTKIVETAITRFGVVDALVNNAGIFLAKPFTEFTTEDFEALSTVNLKGFLYVTRRLETLGEHDLASKRSPKMTD